MSDLQWEAGVGITWVPDGVTEATAPKHYLVCESANIVPTPKIYKRRAAYTPDYTHVVTSGFDYAIEASGITANAEVIGYLLWLMLGGDAFAAGVHTLTPAAQVDYFNFFLDRTQDIDDIAGRTTERALGCKLTSLALEFPEDDYAKASLAGVACNVADPALAPLTPSLPVGADNEPFAWKHLKAGDFQIGLNGGGVAQDDEIKNFKISLERPAKLGGKNLGSVQPTRVKSGLRSLMYSFDKEFTGPNAVAQSKAFRKHQTLELQFRLVVGANYLDIAVPFATFSANPYGQVGAQDEWVMLNVQAEGHAPEAAALITAETKDGSAALYAA